MLTRIGTVTALTLSALISCAGCSNQEKMDTLTRICRESTADLNSGRASADNFMLGVQNALTSCSAACDLKDKPSCEHLEGHVKTLASAVPDTVTSFCNKASGSLKEYACKAKGAK